ncbi:beta-ketoacyl synthase N-terminal-like domain-containing protein [Pseudomonas sp. TTU2014-080ASC]|uniref:beta-ketoacyl synthase N-terminal-like domain-containing protein n=1 Tax=Pseudomonas sp. TTU2014-080ASC TaxID=1729724 RepID=UPI0007188105|nr:beta-ketoacyl synthase N-terminal-like domain-containing protein [Pseudomonas sp. TTU2014-080ASC]KRW58969.1 beta-ketoacyl synthase [Pseudomonas sp. TTU2014-080ASC]
MIPIYLQRATLDCALGADLDSAANALHSGRMPAGETFLLHELNEPRCYLPAQGQRDTLDARLNRVLENTLGANAGELSDCLLIVASTSLDISDLEALTRSNGGFKPEDSTPLDLLSAQLRKHWGFADAFTLNTACTSGANGLLYGARMLASGLYQRAVVMSFETPSAIAQQGFGALMLSSPSGQYRPFHPQRDGLILGEAYACTLLSREPGEQPLARLLGGFSACDTSSLTTTREDGSHIHWVMQQALRSAGCSAEQIDLIKLHGTATSANDEAESNGMRLMYSQQMPHLSLLKPWLGHTLGACGLSETLLLLRTLQTGALPAVDYATDAMLPLPSEPLKLPADSLLLANFFGFGGNNASLVLQGCEQGEQPCA